MKDASSEVNALVEATVARLRAELGADLDTTAKDDFPSPSSRFEQLLGP